MPAGTRPPRVMASMRSNRSPSSRSASPPTRRSSSSQVTISRGWTGAVVAVIGQGYDASAAVRPQLVPPAIARLVADQPPGVVDGQERLAALDRAPERDGGVDRAHQLAAGTRHHRVGSGDDRDLRAVDRGVETEP